MLLTLDQLANVDLDFTVPERFLAVLEPGLPVRATATTYPDDAFEGTIADIDSRVDPVIRAVTVRARLPNADARLRPGMLLAVEIRRDERESPAVPEVAVMRDGERVTVSGVETSDADGASEAGGTSDTGSRALRRAVTLGARDGALIEVTSGLVPGDTIVSEGMHRASDGVPLEIKDTLADEGNAARGAGGDTGGDASGGDTAPAGDAKAGDS